MACQQSSFLIEFYLLLSLKPFRLRRCSFSSAMLLASFLRLMETGSCVHSMNRKAELRHRQRLAHVIAFHSHGAICLAPLAAAMDQEQLWNDYQSPLRDMDSFVRSFGLAQSQHRKLPGGF